MVRNANSSVPSRSSVLANADGSGVMAAYVRPSAIRDKFANSNIDFPARVPL